MPPNPVIDPRLRTLAEVFTPATIGSHLGRALPDHRGAINHVRCHILRHHPGKRCTFQIAFQTPTEERSLIGKVFASDRPDVYRAMAAIRGAGFGREDEFSIPEPLAYVSELRLLLQEHVRGPGAEQIMLTRGETERADASARAARWLARFHAKAPRSGCVTALTDDVSSVRRWAQRIARLGEPVAGQARWLARLLGETAASTRTDGMCAGHGSYDCHQIILADGRTVTLDFDSYDVADPCRDVARFVVALQLLAARQLGSIRALDGAAEVFLETYRALSPFDVAANLRWYRALTCLQLAKYEANLPAGASVEGIEALLDEGLRTLNPPGAPPVTGERSSPSRRATPAVVAPADPGIPTLAAAFDPAELARLLGDRLPRDGSQEMRLSVLRWKPATSCTFSIASPTVGARQELIGKVYAQDRADIYRTMEEIRGAGFEPDSEFGIPRPVAYVAPLRLLLYEKAPGTRARQTIALSSGPESAHAAERCALWLARFHTRGPRSGRVLHVSDQVSSLDEAWRGVADLGSPVTETASRLCERLRSAARRLEGGPLCPGHGMYGPSQVLIADSRTVTIDWDTYQVADPSHDVARFLVELKRIGLKYTGSMTAFDAAAEVFLRTYVDAAGPDVMKRLAFQQAVICLERARHDVDNQSRGWRDKVEAMLKEGIRVLE